MAREVQNNSFKQLEDGKRKLPMYTVDAFTNAAFSGNPAAVCLLHSEEDINDSERQKLGAEMNLSETAFVTPLDSKDFLQGSKFNLRWFTPTNEVDLCGHATLASAAVLFYEIGNRNDRLEFSSRSGPLYVSRSGDKLTLDFPLNPPSPKNQDGLESLLKLVVGDMSLIQEVQLSKNKKLLIRLNDDVKRSQLEALAPRTTEMQGCYSGGDIRGVGVTVRGSPANGCTDSMGGVYDFVSRYFAPWLGIPEDPVTGSWHTVASAYWAKELGKKELYARQCSSRGGELWINVGEERVSLSGQAVVNLKGTFYL